MTSKGDSLKTNEFLRLRKLRLQQVREQSKDIAKKIRQRAKVEQLRHVTNVDPNKEKEYLQRQEKLVNRLQQLYSQNIQNVGAGHKNACEVNNKEIPEIVDLSKLRGKEAAAVLKRKKQEKLDAQKKLLDRKLQAREVANELSREKFAAVANNLIKPSSSKSINNEANDKVGNSDEIISDNIESQDRSGPITKNDMGTQWEFDVIPNEWEPNIPTLPIPIDESLKNSADDNLEGSDQNQKSRQLNLFALSDEMPSSLRGGATNVPDEALPIKPSLTLVSEYLQNRGLRLREHDTTHVRKKHSDDLQSIKQTLLRTRASRTDVSGRSNKVEHSSKSDGNNKELSKKNSVTMYDHNTRDTRDLPRNIENLVVRDQTINDDAYSQALKEVSVVDNTDKPNHTLQQEARNRLAITRQNVDKEYRDTLAFLNSLPKEKPPRSIRTAYMDEKREQELKDKRQHILQQEYKKIEKQTSKHRCKHARHKLAPQEQNRSKSKSPDTVDIDNNIVNRNFQYSWLPVPESDGSMAVHTIPNTVKDNKTGNTVKFSSVDTYHEYRSRHKHTPPTKEDIGSNKRVVEAIIIQDKSNDSMNSSYETDTSSVENLQVKQDSISSRKVNKDTQLADADRIIIYKVMESKKTKKHKIEKKSRNENNIDKNHDFVNQTGDASEIGRQNSEKVTNQDVPDKIETNTVSFTQLKEGIYKSVSANGDNIASLYFSDDQHAGRCCNHEAQNSLFKKKVDHGTEMGMRTEKEHNLDRQPKACDRCKNTDKRPSAATSTSSFKTAVNDKGNNVLFNDNYIKFVDEGEKDTGKFYVGASGFLKDEAYEVVIQLRKKDAEKGSKSSDPENTKVRTSLENNFKESNLEQQFTGFQSANEVIHSMNQNNSENIKSPLKEKSDLLSTKNDVELCQQSTSCDKVAAGELNVVDSTQDKPIVKTPEISDKGISTTFRDVFAISDNVPKLDPTSKPVVASTHTQTTQNSPIPRPMLMHLSSSTSTTYMSPPELILPRYLRKGSSESCDDTYGPISSNMNSQNMKFVGCKTCRCGKCKKQERRAKADTPPNSTRSTDRSTDILSNKEKYKKCTNSENGHNNMRQHKCKNHSESKICSKQKFKRSSSENKRFQSNSNQSTLCNKKIRTKNFDKVNLNPVVENYVTKLLALNKEGLKAIEVVNQECSAVNTPGSSIIDVPSNIIKSESMMCNKISLEQIKNSLEELILKNAGNSKTISKSIVKSIGSQTEKNIKLLYKSNKKRHVHKVKSFNISKQLSKTNKESRRQSTQRTLSNKVILKGGKSNQGCPNIQKRNTRENSSTPRQMNANQEISNTTLNSQRSRKSRKIESGDKVKECKTVTKLRMDNKHYEAKAEMHRKINSYPVSSHKPMGSHSSESEASNDLRNHRNLTTPPISISTQTNQVDSEVEFMKLAESKLQNMEKIADLTEKCTKRLSSLAKVLEEVRKNKSLAYSQISTSDSTSDSDQKSDKIMQTNNIQTKNFNPTVEIQTLTEVLSPPLTKSADQKNHDVNDIPSYVPILGDLPKPNLFRTPSPLSFIAEPNKTDIHIGTEQQFIKNRGKPPPALTRINLKNVPEGFVIPHELSTVVEVDSPMSIKLKNHTTQNDNKCEVIDSDTDTVDNNSNKTDDIHIALDTDNKPVDPNDSISKLNQFKKRHETQSTDTSEDSKTKMMDLKYFNEIMLKPFISLKDYAKQYNLEEQDGITSLNGISKDENINEELSSLHSETSIPDVMAELLKRNLISEPFKFETTSNVNSTTLSSDSTISLLALSKARKDKKKSAMLVKNKENIAETSVSLSISSNPDLEHAFQRLGMGWASSTLKKTKERLALSSSSNTSSSSIPQFKIKSFNYQEVPELSSFNNSNWEEILKPKAGGLSETPKNALMQTSLTNSMTVKEFLTNELANKITFSNKTNRNITEGEFISLCETKIPEEMRHLSQKSKVNEKSVDSLPSGTNNRARTSTPVQIFKSMTYHSTSSSNTSNGLFSNADELSSVKGTSNSIKNHSTSDKDDLTIPNYSLKTRKETTERSKSD